MQAIKEQLASFENGEQDDGETEAAHGFWRMEKVRARLKYLLQLPV